MDKATFIKKMTSLNEYIKYKDNKLTVSCWYDGDEFDPMGQWLDTAFITFKDNGSIRKQYLENLNDRIPQQTRKKIRLLVLDYMDQPETLFVTKTSVFASANLDDPEHLFTNNVYLAPISIPESGRLKMQFTLGDLNKAPQNAVLGVTEQKRETNAVNFIQRGRNEKDNVAMWDKAFQVEKRTIKAKVLKGE